MKSYQLMRNNTHAHRWTILPYYLFIYCVFCERRLSLSDVLSIFLIPIAYAIRVIWAMCRIWPLIKYHMVSIERLNEVVYFFCVFQCKWIKSSEICKLYIYCRVNWVTVSQHKEIHKKKEKNYTQSKKHRKATRRRRRRKKRQTI